MILRKKGMSVAAKKATRVTSEGSVAQLHSCRRQNRCARRSELRERFCGAHRRLQGIGARHRHAHCRQRSEICSQGRRDAGGVRAREGHLSAPRRLPAASRRTSPRRWSNGKMEKFYEEVCLLEQPFIKDQTMTISQLIAAKIGKLGENISRAPLRALQGGRRGRDDCHHEADRAESRVIQRRPVGGLFCCIVVTREGDTPFAHRPFRRATLIAALRDSP